MSRGAGLLGPGTPTRLGRRAILGGLGAALLVAPFAGAAPTPRPARRIGYLSPSRPNELESAWLAELLGVLRLEGSSRDADVVLVPRYAEERLDRLPALAAELVELRVEVILTFATPASLAARTATRTIPIVMVAVGDPVGVGLVSRLNRPEGNVTGMVLNNVDSAGKRMELLKEAAPRMTHAAILAHGGNPSFIALQLAQTQHVADRVGVTLTVFTMEEPESLGARFASMSRAGADGIIILPDAVFFAHRARIADLALRHRLPSAVGAGPFVDAGCMLGYGPDVADVYRRAGRYVQSLLEGAQPADLPVEQPTRYALVINGRTARALKVAIPPALIARADEVIE